MGGRGSDCCGEETGENRERKPTMGRRRGGGGAAPGGVPAGDQVHKMCGLLAKSLQPLSAQAEGPDWVPVAVSGLCTSTPVSPSRDMAGMHPSCL